MDRAEPLKRIICTVTNDLNYDQRMHRICNSLVQGGYEVLLVGRLKKNSTDLKTRSFKQKRINCLFEKGKLFYLEYNFRLFWFLLFSKFEVICSIDLDTVLPGYLVKLFRRKKLVFDAHEYFTELEEVVHRPFTKSVWRFVERLTLRKIDAGYTISFGYQKLYANIGVELDIIRNITVLRDFPEQERKYILYQGAVNHGRGLEELFEAMKKVDSHLVVCGEGDIYDALKSKIALDHLQDKITMKGYLKPEELAQITPGALIGITLFAADGMSNKHSLCNRFFDYMHNGVPQLAMNYPEYAKFNEQFEVSYLLETLEPDEISAGLNLLLSNKSLWERLQVNALEARKKYNWQSEEQKLLSIYRNLGGKVS
ncbi:MAG: glycosyltransferase [Flavobacteriales bacterium]|nr:glycosyltransferase [Flavobacteriales bacterium]